MRDPTLNWGRAGELIMSINLRESDRDQLFLLPPSVVDWLPSDHLAFFVLDVVAELDLAAFYADYRSDGRGGAAYDPALVLAVLIYAYCVGEHSSRRIERRLTEDVAFRVVGANQQLDHATLARFRRRHTEPIAELFGQVLGLCVREGLVQARVISIDGTKIEANASAWSNRTRRQLAEEILAEAERVDAELAAAPLILREVGSGTREVLESALSSLHLSVTALFELGSTTAIKSAVLSGTGPGVLSRLAVESDLTANRLVAVPLEGLSLDRSIRAVWLRDRPSPPALLLLRQIGG